MSEIEIVCVPTDRGIPMPVKYAAAIKYPWLTLSPGDSFVWLGTPDNARSATRYRRTRYGEHYRVAKVTENGKHIIRIWRIPSPVEGLGK